MRPKQRVASRSVSWRRHSSLATDGPGGSDNENEDNVLGSEDLDMVVDFFTGKSARQEAAEKEAAADEATATAAKVQDQDEPKKLEAPEESSSAGLLPAEAESRHETHEDNGAHKKHNRVTELQDQLLTILATLDRGLAASATDVTKVENLALQLENASEPVILDFSSSNATASNNGKKSGMELLDGRWRLAYSSGFSGGNLGGRRPGPPASLLPLTLGAVYQDIFVSAKELDNVVTLTAKISLANLFQADPPAITARLKHSFTIEGASTVRIVFEKTIAKTAGGIGGWLDSLPQFATPMLPESLRPMTAPARDATFEITFLDEKMRITRGDRGELRVFVKEI